MKGAGQGLLMSWFWVLAGGRVAYPKGAKPTANTQKSSFSHALEQGQGVEHTRLSDLRECLKTRQKEGGRANLLDDQITTSLPDRPQ